MSEAIAWLEEAKETLTGWDYTGRLPHPQPKYTDQELKQIIIDFWSEKWTVGETYAWLLASGQDINPFEIKRVFDDMDFLLEQHEGSS